MKKYILGLALISILASCSKDPEACFDASSSNVTVGTAITFTSCANNGSKVLWDFGDGTKGEGENVSHAYDRGGVYLVEMKVYSKKEKSWDRATRIINVGAGKTRFLSKIEVNSFNINKPDGSTWDALVNTEPDIFIDYGIANSGNTFVTTTFNDAKLNQLPLVWDFGPNPNKVILTDANWRFQMRDADITGSELMEEFSINPLTAVATSPGKLVLTNQNNQITISFIEL